jgi:hypothetical protein
VTRTAVDFTSDWTQQAIDFDLVSVVNGRSGPWQLLGRLQGFPPRARLKAAVTPDPVPARITQHADLPQYALPTSRLLIIRLFQPATIFRVGVCGALHFLRMCMSSAANLPLKRPASSSWNAVAGLRASCVRVAVIVEPTWSRTDAGNARRVGIKFR